ncbi:hypothetical protein [Aquimarina aquimarini]|uniref:hypothetical protein n=1 Tax=Aquimarina aquimarini TaxID=1191734 RepID=UPI000D55B862|nr:hypothetical protein [Aquimarina aquimarini]
MKFNDDYDEFLIFVETNNDTITLIYNNEKQNKYNKGDKITINWKIDSIRYAGDSEFLGFKEFLISSKKIENSTSSKLYQ